MWRALGFAFVGTATVALASVSGAQEHGRTAESGKRINVNSAQQALRLLRTELVQNEIRLTDDQKKELAPLLATLEGAFQEANRRSRELPRGERDRKMAEEINTADERIKTTVQTILLPSQFNRLEEIGLQVCGAGLFTSRNIVDALRVSSEQRGKIDRVLEERGRRLGDLFAKARVDVPQIESKDYQARTRHVSGEEDAIEKAAIDEIFGLLTPQQRGRLREMRGKEIDVGKLKAELLGAGEENRIGPTK